MAQLGNFAQEGQSSNRPPLLYGTENYNFWKFRMKIYLQRDPWEWWVVENGPFVAIDEKGKEKKLEDMDASEILKSSYNAKAMNTLLCGMVQSEVDKISSCETAKDMWDTLKISHEGTSKVKELKLSMLMQDYEMFKLGKEESVKEAQARFLVLMNSLKLLDKSIPQSEINRKILRAMPKRFASKITTLQDSSNISSMSTLTLFSELDEYEHQLKRYDEEEETPRKKVLALNAGNEEEHVEDSDEEIAMLSRKLKGMIQRKNRRTYSNRSKGNQQEEGCYECGRPGHYKRECFLLKNRNKSASKDTKKSKAFFTWSDDESEVEVDPNDEIAQVCFMANEDPSSEVNESSFDLLLQENKKLKEKNSHLKEMVTTLMEELDAHVENSDLELEVHDHDKNVMKAQNDYLENYNKILFNKVGYYKRELEQFSNREKDLKMSILNLERRIIDLQSSLAKFVLGENNLTVMLSKQNPSYEKQGIGYHKSSDSDNETKVDPDFSEGNTNLLNAQTSFKLDYAFPFYICKKCGRRGHLEKYCSPKSKVRKVWIRKSDLHGTNKTGPNQIWVPKI